ncbi:MAG: T9SS type A sorting domain-containing protein [Bacteroidetes bacterium]|nr:T9SS type A sorting domain-containing protein [Bacteroidota bacterium]
MGNSGCNQGNAATVTSNLLPQVIAPPTLVSSGGVMSMPATIANSGCIQTNLCLTSTLVENNSLEHLTFYPNPITTKAFFEITLIETKSISISIIDVVGREIRTIPTNNLEQGKNKIAIDFSELHTGIYFCQIKSKGIIQTLKFVKQ